MSYLTAARLRRTAVVLSAVTATALLAPVSALAGIAPGTTPTITSPADDTAVSTQNVTVTATSGATHVRFVLDGLVGNTDYEELVAVSTGTATTSFSVLGFDGPTSIEAFDCEVGGSCNPTGATPVNILVTVAPEITAPKPKTVVGNSVDVKVDALGGRVQYSLDGDDVGSPVPAGFDRTVSLRDEPEGQHTIKARQCNADGTICDGASDALTVIKDTRGPRWSDLSTSNRTVFPVKDRYKDSTVLSARVGERSVETKVEIRKAGGPLIRTIKLGRVDAGKVRATWNGRKSNGDVADKGKYLFRFVGTDTHGIVGKSNDKVVYVSDKRLERRTSTKTMSAVASFRGNGSGSCSDLFHLDYPKARFDWPKGVGYYSNVYCRGTGDSAVAIGGHSIGLENAVRYGSASIQAYGAGAFKHAGPGAMLSLKANGDIGATAQLGTSPGWYGVKGIDLDTYARGGRLRWFVGTAKGNWYDVKEFKVSYSYFVLR